MKFYCYGGDCITHLGFKITDFNKNIVLTIKILFGSVYLNETVFFSFIFVYKLFTTNGIRVDYKYAA